MNKKIQAKDIPDVSLLLTIMVLAGPEQKSVTCWRVQAFFPDVPPGVVNAKCNALVRRGLLDGCTCGCRGDFELTATGRAVLLS